MEYPSGVYAYFYGYTNTNGDTQWLLTDAPIPKPIVQNKRYTTQLVSGFAGNGGSFTNKPTTANSGTAYWGTLDLTFTSCTTAVAVLTGKEGNVTHNMIKLANIDGLSCQKHPSKPPITSVIPSELDALYRNPSNQFDRYTHVLAPNGKPIHIVAQTKLTDEQIIRARQVLKHYLTDLPGSAYGSDKSAVANKMSENKAVLVLLNGADDGSNPVADQVTEQPLYQNEIQTEGSDWYINQNYEHRDATFEEILHFVHDNGIGVDGASTVGALPQFQAEIRSAQKNALNKNLWGINSAAWIAELTRENSLSQEYLAAVIDSYYGLWGAYKEHASNGMWGLYVGKDRADIKAEDPMGYALADGRFFHPYLTYNARIDAKFQGNFSLKFNPRKPYTHHAQYLKDITLLGTNNNSVTVNGHNNHITGNSGTNTVVFSGASDQYQIHRTHDAIMVIDTNSNRDGANILSKIEKLKFTDKTITL